MEQITNTFVDIYRWAERDYKEWSFRFILEVLAWCLSIGCSFTMALTVPNPPLIILYPIWMFGCLIYAWASWTRGSFGMLANYILLVSIDTFAYIRMVTN